ncbi:hypothetical protein VNI00_009081 [Paramarasmius palmivorus]|uniref:Uncharacterized protein n=1 Tax=Paramarasmius palmivorus TaxID=297713 RepID=A0AAW0CP51_9AGAR
MHSSQNRGGYSSFFASGFRAISSRSSIVNSSPNICVTEDKVPSFPAIHSQNAPEKHQRRTSFMLNLFDKMATKTSDAYKKRKDTKRASLFVESDSKPLDLWTWPESQHHPYASRKSSVGTRYGLLYSILLALGSHRHHTGSAENSPQQVSVDPFSSSPDSKSFFIDLTDTPTTTTSTPSRRFSLQPPARTRRYSFLSLSSSSRENSVVNFPNPTRRERPVSMYTMPTHTSFLDAYRLQASSVRSSSPRMSGWVEDDSEEEASRGPLEWNDPGSVDWHQFHGQWLSDTDCDSDSGDEVF